MLARIGNRRLFCSLTRVDASNTTVQLTSSPKPKTPFKDLTFGTTFTDHMLEVDWTKEGGWQTPNIRPFGNLDLHPAVSSLHYGLEIFEGMKAYKDGEGRTRLFRPDRNMARMNYGASRMSLPNFDGVGMLEAIKELLRVDDSWIPDEEGFALYIRPTLVSNHPFLGVGSCSEAKFFTILCPVGPYYPEGFKPVKLLADRTYVRAWPGGTGDTKCGGNYAPTILPQAKAAEQGCSQVMWLFGEEDFVTEVGTMNQFFFWINKDTGRKELVTAPLDGTILPGVTRSSILEIVREWGEFDVSERNVKMSEVVEAIDDGRMLESFGSGTAAVVCPVSGILYQGRDLTIPLGETGTAGDLTERLWNTMNSIYYGKSDSDYSVIV